MFRCRNSCINDYDSLVTCRAQTNAPEDVIFSKVLPAVYVGRDDWYGDTGSASHHADITATTTTTT